MFLKLLISVSVLSLYFGHVAATSCHELQLNQLKSLNERMNQIIHTISSLLPKSLRHLSPTLPPTPALPVNYVPSTGQETRYYSPTTYSTPPPVQHVMYVPSYAVPTDIRVPRHMNPMTPQHYLQPEIAQRESLPTATSFPPQTSISYQYEQPLQYISPIPAPNLPPPLYPAPYPLIQSPYPTEYIHPYPVGYPIPASTPNIPAYAPGLPFIPVPVQIPPGPYMPTYPQVPEVPQNYT